ncbi:actin-related protein [Spathaspora passalidarum NRRL Y-27907]|uniref:Actin-related protein 4 n=1 Tax=Spathaspora passalidarum (strain NRRL Y-27907 / 11-Y1) TaxID=619300 RepID=G3AUS1_SPAPN|nr:actin-related protein [Spathaspora passalidarum NRRL Y-27907]EGW30627.1 actin-related protein [Spathaspora passalidarum NRRL Y-27907]
MSSGGNTTTVYGGDEISAIILDPGSYNTRIGYAGDDFPKVTTSSFYGQVGNGKRIFGEDINVPRENCEIKPILKDSIITDWDAAIDQYKYYFEDTLKVDYKDQPVLITEPIWTELPYRQKLIETFYETFDFAGLYLAKAPTCISFQQGRPNCLVVDLGHDTVSVTPVIDGICLIKNSMRTNYGGRFLNDEIKDFVKSRDPKIAVEPTYKIKTKTPTVYPDPAEYTVKKTIPTTTESFNKFQQQRIWHEFKETALEVPERKLNSTNPQQALSIKEFYSQDSQKRLFEFPTGQSITLGLERFQFAESIFDPKIYKFSDENIAKAYPPNNGEIKISSHYNEYRPLKRIRKPESNQSTPAPGEGDDSSEKIRGLSHLITHTLSTIDIDLRASVAHNIIVTGGVSLIPQLIERLYNELSNSNPGLKIRLHAVGNSSERVNQAWIGGSVLASLGTFHQMWVTKHEYNEAGADRILNQRFR